MNEQSNEQYKPIDKEIINHPPHYTRSIECIDCIAAVVEHMHNEYAFLAGQVIKYLYRCTDKGHFTEDLLKAQWYMNRLADKATAPPKF